MAEKKQNESRFMAMLERRGIVRKVDTDDASADDSNRLRADNDLLSLLEMSSDDSDASLVSPQPVPGMPKPVFPSDRPASAQPSQAWPAKAAERKKPSADLPLAGEHQQRQPQTSPLPQEGAHGGSAAADREQAKLMSSMETAASKPSPAAVSHKQRSLFSGDLPPLGPALQDEQPSVTPHSGSFLARPAPEIPPEPPPANHTERFLDINELFDVLSLNSNRTDTIYLIEEYLETIPESLPEEARRDIVSKIVSASGFDFSLLVGDGVLRVRMLREYAENFAKYTEDYITARQAELDELERQIINIRKLIEKRRELHKKQFLVIEAEAQRLKEVLAFVAK